MSDLSPSITQSPVQVAEPALQMVEQQINVLTQLSSQIRDMMRGVLNKDAIQVQDDPDYEILKSRVFSNLM